MDDYSEHLLSEVAVTLSRHQPRYHGVDEHDWYFTCGDSNDGGCAWRTSDECEDPQAEHTRHQAEALAGQGLLSNSPTPIPEQDARDRLWFTSGWDAALQEVEGWIAAGRGLDQFLAEQRAQRAER